MKPHLLVMSAFGPYGKQVEVDFDRFDGKGLFLITGDTGAGKTTIFNAMTYALYGMMNDGRRKSIRSDFADPSTPTFVEMMFSHNGVDYTIHRQPEQERPKQRGKGTKIVASGVSLVFQDRTVTKDSEVSEIIEDILGMNFNQWKQVSMIAQGEFRKILDSKTTERGEIFRRIFSTDPVKR
ncbi:MAG: SMC family ATPase, partial [Candidatus Methanomethylophilaceae archaeon]|nr:SMC family ATPase [Candidatus Methanomethylophilaceae archaeon]